jgi:hypothetical protein
MKMQLQILAVAGAALAGAPAFAQEVPNLVGTWTGTFKEMHFTGPAEQSLQFKVLEQDGPLLKAEKTWHIVSGTAGDVGGQSRTDAVEPLVGVVDFDGTIYFAEQGDAGLYRGRVTGPDTIEVVYVEAGQLATAYRAELTRQK